jgi:carboxypeptidase PM20D1
MRKLLLGLLLVVALLAAVVVWRAASFRSKQLAVQPAPKLAFDRDAAAERLAGALRFRTVSNLDPAQVDWQAFEGLHRYLAEQFPLVHQRLKRETVSDYSLLFTWAGSDPSLRPVVLLSHQDVVPVEPGTEARWTQPPFEGRIADGYIWGRGALDDKFGVVGLLQAAEILLAAGYQPKRTILFAFGHDEEVGGDRGAVKIAERLAKRGVQAELVLDEGGSVVSGLIPGLDQRVGLVGIAEKGMLSLALQAATEGGHSSAPPNHTAVGIAAAAVVKLENDQMPMSLRGPVQQTIDYVGPELPFTYRLFLANLWLVQPLIEGAAANVPALAATLRTTTAATMFSGGVKENVLPSSARAVVNFRVLPGDTIATVTEHATRVVDDPRVKIEQHGVAREPSPESPTGEAFTLLSRAIREVFPDVVVAPYLVPGGTDSRYYTSITPNVYRFTPIVADQTDLKRIHGTDERMSVENYGQVVQFYARLMQNAGG